MTKKQIIPLIIICSLLALILVLFGAVFCLRSTTVEIGEGVAYSSGEIVKAAKLKNGKSIFMQNKQQAINNIENKFADLKVVQIKTTSLTTLEIKVRKREPLFYIKTATKFYVVDEELKVLNIIEFNGTNEPTNLVLLDYSYSKLGISESTTVCDFLADEHLRRVTYTLFVAMHNTVKIDDVDGNEQPIKRFVEREDIPSLVKKIAFSTDVTLKGSYNCVILSTVSGVVIDIGKPENDMERKVNTCFSAYSSADVDNTSGTIKLFYDKNNIEKIAYFPEEI